MVGRISMGTSKYLQTEPRKGQRGRQRSEGRVVRLNVDLQSSESHSMVWMLKSMVRLALVTSVQWTPPLLPPVRHWGNKDLTPSKTTFPPRWQK